MKGIHYIILAVFFVLASCTGSKKYFKAAERLEKQGLLSDAANYYLVSLQRKPTFVDARIKLKEVGQKHVSGLASDFFRNYNTQQLEASLSTFETLKEFYIKASSLNVLLDYPKTYDDDYKNAVETYCEKNYASASKFIYDKKYSEAASYISKIKKYNGQYKNVQQLDVIATCEPLYQRAISNIENKNYSSAYSYLNDIKLKADQYKDANALFELCLSKQNKTYILFQPPNSGDNGEQAIEEYLFNNFNQLGLTSTNLKLINNSPFQTPLIFNSMYNNENIDLIQAIRKASGADFYYLFDVSNRKEYNSGLNKTMARAYREYKRRINDSTEVTEYKPVEYNVVKSQRSFSFDLKYKIINAGTGQMIATQQQNIRSLDAIEYHEFVKPFDGNVNNLYPYNPQQTSAAAQFNPRSWRNMFTARANLKSMDDLKSDTYNQSLSIFKSSLTKMK